jgi:hypothetical protein
LDDTCGKFPPVLATPAVLVAKFATVVVDTGAPSLSNIDKNVRKKF